MRLILLLAAVAGALGLTVPAAQSDCGEPRIAIEGSPGSGGSVVIEGDGFAVGCDETGGSAESGSETGTETQAGSEEEAGSGSGSVAAGGCSVEGSSTGSSQSAEDTGSGEPGEDTGSGEPMQNVRVTIIQDGENYVLGVRDGNESAEIRIETDLPEELHEGIATVHAESASGEDAEATITIGEQSQ